LALFFETSPTLAEITGILRDVEEFYAVCLDIVVPEGEARPGIASPRIDVSVGSLFLELAGSLESGAWTGSAIVLMKFLLKHGRAVAQLPDQIRVDHSVMRVKLEENNEKLDAVRRRRPSVDEKARLKARKARAKKVGDQAGARRFVEEHCVVVPKLWFEDEGDLRIPQSDGVLQQFREVIRSIAESAKNSAHGFEDFSRRRAKLLDTLVTATSGTADKVLEESVQALGSTAQPLDDLIRLLYATYSGLDRYAWRL
jgi:hypothetical protein